MIQDQLFEADDFLEEGQGWIYYPGKEASDEELRELFETMTAILSEPNEGGAR